MAVQKVKSDLSVAVDKAMVEPTFRMELFTNPEKALEDAGLSITDAELANIKNIQADLQIRAEESLRELAKGVSALSKPTNGNCWGKLQ